jgi:hypothetical protein
VFKKSKMHKKPLSQPFCSKIRVSQSKMKRKKPKIQMRLFSEMYHKTKMRFRPRATSIPRVDICMKVVAIH